MKQRIEQVEDTATCGCRKLGFSGVALACGCRISGFAWKRALFGEAVAVERSLPEIGCDVQRDVVFARARELRKRRELERGTAVPLREPNRDAETPPLVFSSRLGLSLGYS